MLIDIMHFTIILCIKKIYSRLFKLYNICVCIAFFAIWFVEIALSGIFVGVLYKCDIIEFFVPF